MLNSENSEKLMDDKRKFEAGAKTFLSGEASGSGVAKKILAMGWEKL